MNAQKCHIETGERNHVVAEHPERACTISGPEKEIRTRQAVISPERLADLLERYSEPEPNSGCRIWIGARMSGPDGYGEFRLNGRPAYAHRAVYEAAHGPTDLDILHRCDMKSCVEERHLYAGTHGQNMADVWRARRSGRLRPWRYKTHCPRGHSYEGRSARKECRVCARERLRSRNRTLRPRNDEVLA